MKRPLIIAAGITFIIIVALFWVYLLVYGTPQSAQDIFSNLDTGSTAERPEAEPLSEIDTTDTKALVNIDGAQLQQITTSAVAGFVFATTSTGEVVRYVEAGTGHIYEINLTSGVSTQVSPTTIPGTVDAIFSPNGSAVVFNAKLKDDTKMVVGEIPNTTGVDIQQTLLPAEVENIAFRDEKTILYTVSNGQRTEGYSKNIQTQTTDNLFSLPLPNLVVRWGAGIASTYAYPKPTEYLDGHLYEVKGGALLPTSVSGKGLTAFAYGDSVISNTINDDGKYTTSFYDTNTKLSIKQSLLMLPEKCVVDSTNRNNVWCASELKAIDGSFLEQWYKGITSLDETIWKIHTPTQASELIIDPEITAGRDVDATSLEMNGGATRLLFKNKIDNTLWLLNTKLNTL